MLRLSERALTVRDFAAANTAAVMNRGWSAQPSESVGSTGGSGAECGVCLDAPEEPLVSPCGHVFCKSCIRDALSQERRWEWDTQGAAAMDCVVEARPDLVDCHRILF